MSRPAGGWHGGHVLWLGSVYSEASPFDTPWRRQKGGLWDLGPHAVSLLWAVLGPVTSVTADTGRGDLTHLVLHHEGGATSTVTLTLGAPEAADGFDLLIWGERGRASIPPLADDPVGALRVALSELAGNAASGRASHPCDASFGRAVTRVLTQAQHAIDAQPTLSHLSRETRHRDRPIPEFAVTAGWPGLASRMVAPHLRRRRQ